KEMCHEEIPHRDRVDLAAYHPGSRECQRGPCFAVEPRIRRQRLLTSSRANEHLCSQAQLSQAAVWHTRAGCPPMERGRQWVRLISPPCLPSGSSRCGSALPRLASPKTHSMLCRPMPRRRAAHTLSEEPAEPSAAP